MERPSLRAGQVAASAGVHREMLRYYERRRLIPAPPRRLSGYRAYPVETVERVRLIKWAQGLGFSLREIGMGVPGRWQLSHPGPRVERGEAEMSDRARSRRRQSSPRDMLFA